MAQLYLKSGMKHWKVNGQAADKYEMEQLHFRDTFNPNHYKELTEDQKKIILESCMFLKEKINGKIKGKTVAERNKQRDFISKECSIYLSVATRAVLLSCIIDAEEERVYL